jgi:putative tricarboxylic transport membrane protein
MLGDFADGLSYLGNLGYWGGFLFAVFITVPIALLPGISATLVMALTIPFIIISVEDPVIGVAMLATLTGIDNTLDSIPSILLGMPGGATQVTFLEGNQLARQGYAAHTLGAVYAVSALGGMIGALMMALLIPMIKPVVLAFGFAEIAAMAMFGVAMVAA